LDFNGSAGAPRSLTGDTGRAGIESLEGRLLLSHVPVGLDDGREKFELADGRYRGYISVDDDNGLLPEDPERLCTGKPKRVNYNLELENHEDGTVSGHLRAREFGGVEGRIAFTGTKDGRRLELQFEEGNEFLDRFEGRVSPSGWYIRGNFLSDDNDAIEGWTRFRELRFANDHDDLNDDGKDNGKKAGKEKNDGLFNSTNKVTD
jgi:hypothetical protein